MKHICISIVLITISIVSWSQTTIVSGRVFDGETGQALPYVSVSFAGTSIGTMTNIKGVYKLESEKKVNRIVVSFMGFSSQSIPFKNKSDKRLMSLWSLEVYSLLLQK